MNWEREAAERLPTLLEGWLRSPVSVDLMGREGGPDLLLRTKRATLAIEVKGTDAISGIDGAAHQAQRHASALDAHGLIVVPYMGPKARAWAAERGLSWADLSGNAEIRAEGLCIVATGAKNRYAARGRPSNPFTPRYSRVSRALLADADRWWRQVEIAEEVGLPSGTVSKVVQRLAASDLLEHDADGRLRARAPSLLLDAWAQRYRFADQAVRRYHLTARSGPGALETLAGRLSERHARFAATGLAGAWLYSAFADFRVTTLLVDQYPADAEELGLREVERGENVWLVVPNDEGAFYGRVEQGTWAAHPVQVYLDLLGHPERASDAALELRAQWLAWRA